MAQRWSGSFGEGLRVLVTAGASGIGRAIAGAFAEHGARVHICDNSEELLRTCKAERPDLGATLCDVGDEAQVDRLSRTFWRRWAASTS